MFNIIQGQAHLTPCSKVNTASLLIRAPKTMFISLFTNKWEGMDREEEAVSFFSWKEMQRVLSCNLVGRL